MSDYVFKLGLDSHGMTVNGDNSGEVEVCFSKTSSADAVFSEKTLTFTLYALNFHRELYEPGHIEAEILIQTKLKKNVSIDLTFVESLLLRRPVSLYIDTTQVAKDYYIHAFTPIFETSEWAYVEETKDPRGQTVKTNEKGTAYDIYTKLDIYSMDKLLTLDKFSRAYLGKKLMKNIIVGGVEEFKLGFSYLKDGGKETMDKTVAANALLNLDRLSNDGVELIHPYLVQYNESFYDFIRRVANRCGEPLYFEDGQLCMGLLKGNANACATPSRLIYNSVSGAAVSVDWYSRDSAKSGISKPKDFNDESAGRESDGFPADAFISDQHPYNSELAAEEHYILLYKDKFARRSAEKFTTAKSHLFFDKDHALAGVSVVPEVLNSTSLVELLTDFAFQLTINGINYAVAVSNANKKGKKLMEPYVFDSDDLVTLFVKAGTDAKNWITLQYYKDVRPVQEEQERKRICVDMGEVLENRKLGEIVTVPGAGTTPYVVEQIDISSGTDWRRSYDPSVPSKAADNLVDGSPSMQFRAIPMASDGSFYPPVLPDNPFRRASGPQPAFVTDADDPKRQGRVRIRFAWQPRISDTSSSSLDSLKKDLETAKDDEKKYRKDLEAYTKKSVSYSCDADYTVTVNAEMKEDADASKYEDALSDYEEKCVAYEKAKHAVYAAEHKYDDDSSPWIRMVSPMATDTGGGMYFRPEVGDEVMVDFENGNIDHPFVTGALFSKNTPAPDVGKRAIVSRNGHTIRFIDPDDASLFMAGAYPGLKLLKSYSVPIDFDVKGARPALGGIEMTDRCGLYRIMMSSHDRKIAISSPFGDVDIDAFTGITLSAPNGNIKIVGQNVEITANNNLTLTSGENIKNGAFYKLDALDALKNLGKKTAGATYGAFLDFTLLRTILEVFIRPVDGTLKIKSNRYLLLEAGEGEAAIAADQYEQESKYKSYTAADVQKAQNDTQLRFDQASADVADIITLLQTTVPTILNDYINSFVTAFNGLKAAFDALKNPSMYFKENEEDTDHYCFSNEYKSPLDIIKHIVGNINADAAGMDSQIVDSFLGKNGDSYDNITLYEHLSEDYDKAGSYAKVVSAGQAALSIKRVVKSYNDLKDHLPPKYGSMKGAFATILNNSCPMRPKPVPEADNQTVLYTWIKIINNISGAGEAVFSNSLTPVSFDSWKQSIVRRFAKAFIDSRINNPAGNSYVLKLREYNKKPHPSGAGYLDPPPGDIAEPYSQKDWARYVYAIYLEEAVVGKESGSEAFAEGFGEPWKQFKHWTEWKVWSDASKGEIVFSDHNDVSYHFKDNGMPEKYVTKFSNNLPALSTRLRNAIKTL